MLNSLSLIQWMSGMVDVLECVWEENTRALVFIVKRGSEQLFRGKGGLCATPVAGYRVPAQSLLVSAQSATAAPQYHPQLQA